VAGFSLLYYLLEGVARVMKFLRNFTHTFAFDMISPSNTFDFVHLNHSP